MSEVDNTTYQSIGGKKMVKSKLGSGHRFAALKAKVGREKGVSNPGAVAASVGRKKWGNAKMQQMAVKGRMDNESAGHEKKESKSKETAEDK